MTAFGEKYCNHLRSQPRLLDSLHCFFSDYKYKTKNKQPNQKVGKRPKQTFLQRRHTDDQQTQEKMLINREMQIKTIMRCHLKPVGI